MGFFFSSFFCVHVKNKKRAGKKVRKYSTVYLDMKKEEEKQR
jgi:hypothetical protein